MRVYVCVCVFHFARALTCAAVVVVGDEIAREQASTGVKKGG